GFSLVRKLFFDVLGWKIDRYLDELGCTLGEALLVPTRIYAETIVDLVGKFDIRGMSHITGGGFYENIPRMIPEGLSADIVTRHINMPPILKIIQREGNIDLDEMYSTFNMGIGIVLAVAKDDFDMIMRYLTEQGEEPVFLGEINKRSGELKLCHQ
ncbi:MAG: AIR synthase-related protein, partial [Eubacteriales bacterium]|nr:AIR synthase-related protein [Eubacteriales bacterium]